MRGQVKDIINKISKREIYENLNKFKLFDIGKHIKIPPIPK